MAINKVSSADREAIEAHKAAYLASLSPEERAEIERNALEWAKSVEAAVAVRFAEAGQQIVGIVERYDSRETEYGIHPICVVRVINSTATGKGGLELPFGSLAGIHIMQQVLREAFADQGPKVGEQILVQYGGKVTTEDGTGSYHDFSLSVNRPVEAPDPNALPDFLTDKQKAKRGA